MAAIKEYVLETSHAMVGNTIDHEYSVIIEFRANATSYPFSTYVLNSNRPGIRKNMDNHHSLRDATKAADELLAERRQFITNLALSAKES